MWTLDPFPETDLLPCRHVNTEEQEEEFAKQYERLCNLWVLEAAIRQRYAYKIARRLSQKKMYVDLEVRRDAEIEYLRNACRKDKV